MKIISTFFVFFYFTASQAQSLTFEQTVNYINELFANNDVGYIIPSRSNFDYVAGISAKKDGTIVFYAAKFVDRKRTIFDLKTNSPMVSFNLTEIVSITPESSRLLFRPDIGGTLDGLNEGNVSRLIKAFEHLKSLCTEEDPFGK